MHTLLVRYNTGSPHGLLDECERVLKMEHNSSGPWSEEGHFVEFELHPSVSIVQYGILCDWFKGWFDRYEMTIALYDGDLIAKTASPRAGACRAIKVG